MDENITGSRSRDLSGQLLLSSNDELGRSLRALPIFAGLPDELVESLGPVSGLIEVSAGEAVLTQGQVNKHLFVLLDGRLGVYVSGEKIAELSRRGDLVGEMSLISATPCSASVIAESSCQMFAVDMSMKNEILGANDQFNNFLYKLYSAILVDRLIATNAKARQFEETNRLLQAAKDEVQMSNDKLEIKVEERTYDLKCRTEELETQNAALLASQRKIDDLYRSRTSAMEQLTHVVKNELEPLRGTLQALAATAGEDAQGSVTKSLKNIKRLQIEISPLSSAYFAERAVASARVLLAEDGFKESAVARMALGGSGVKLDVVSDLDSGKAMLIKNTYDVVLTNLKLIDLTRIALERNAEVKTVVVTSAPGAEIIAGLCNYPHLSNVVARSDTDRTFTIKNILTTITKLVSGDIFGMEKFLNWGVEVQSRTVVASSVRHENVLEVEKYFKSLGASSHVVRSIAMVTEELLTNAIFDAPVDATGNPRYQFQHRSKPVMLEPHEYATLRFATDGIIAAVSVEDPFGSLDRATILDYLDRCYRGEYDAPDKRKGGGGLGTFQMMEIADLVVYNVHPNIRTEVIALFSLENFSRNRANKSFHYFGI
jgi:CRP-like cAMP-binding protein